jgi:hypothetical protein
MAVEQIDATKAFTRLRRTARSSGRPLCDVAREVIDGVSHSRTLTGQHSLSSAGVRRRRVTARLKCSQ